MHSVFTKTYLKPGCWFFLSAQIKEATVHTARVNAGKGSLPVSSHGYSFTLPNPKHQAGKTAHLFLYIRLISSMHYKCIGL